MMVISKTLQFDAAHRLYDYIGKCANIHGHRYTVLFNISTDCLDHRTISVDFKDIKFLFQGWLDDKWDHKLILNIHDPLVDSMEELVKSNTILGLELPYCMPCNPTAEGMAHYLATSIFPEILERAKLPAKIVSVTVYETPTSSACYVVDSNV